MKNLLLYSCLFFCFAFPSIAQQNIKVQILDENGLPTPARVRFINLARTYFAPKGHLADFPITKADGQEAVERDVLMDIGRRFAYEDGEFDISLPEEQVIIEVVKGFQYLIYKDTVDISTLVENKIEIQLQKFVDLAEKNWYSGDVHVHHINPETALLEMKAEDVHVCNILISDFTADHDLFRGEIEPISDAKHLIYLGQEYREDRLGHVNLLNIKEKLVAPTKEKRPHQYPLNAKAYDQIHSYGGHLSWAHFAAWPGLEGPLSAVLKKLDAVELLCTIDPFHEPIFADDVVPEVRLNSGLRMWYRLLNCGLQIPITAGTDKMNNQVTVGANRVFVKVDSAFTYDSWIKAINEGKTFVSNNPFLFLKVEGEEPGGLIQISGKESLDITAEVWSQLPIDRLEIVANGQLIAEKKMSKEETYAKLTFSFQPKESAWIAARAYQFSKPDARRGLSLAQRRDAGGGPTLFNKYFGTLRPETIFAHTSPIYILKNSQPIRSSEDAAYFIQYLKNAVEWLEVDGSFPTNEAKKEVLEAFQKGIDHFEALIPK